MKLLITGGHVTPALAVIDEIKDSSSNIQVVFVGRKCATNAKDEETMEYKEITSRAIPFYDLKTGRLTRVLSFESFKNLLQLPKGLITAFKIVQEIKPDKVLSFGGYIALPICIAAYIKKIPVYTHEQTIHPGLANQIISHFAKQIFLSFQESKKYVPYKSILVVGNPIRKFVLESKNVPFAINKNRPVIYITGGSLGSHAINVHIEKILPELLKKYTVIHQIGNVKKFNDFNRLKTIKDSLLENLKSHYFPVEHFHSSEIGYIYSQSDLVIGRSGANTFFELLALQKPALFIPLPWAANNEQEKQAILFKEWNVGEVFDQEKSSDELLILINKMIENISIYKNSFQTISMPYEKNAATTIVQALNN